MNLRYQGRLQEAEVAAREAVEGLVENFGQGNLAAQSPRRCLGLVLRDQGRNKEAVDILRLVLREQENPQGLRKP